MTRRKKQDRRKQADRRDVTRTGGKLDRIIDKTHQILRKHER
jgi:hypothetical protein